VTNFSAPQVAIPKAIGGAVGGSKQKKEDYLANVGTAMYKQSLDASTASSTFKEIINQCERAGRAFSDGDFPPAWRSLWGHGESLSGVYEEDWADYEFAPAKEIFPKGYKLFDTI
jgi:hypothetical protein